MKYKKGWNKPEDLPPTSQNTFLLENGYLFTYNTRQQARIIKNNIKGHYFYQDRFRKIIKVRCYKKDFVGANNYSSAFTKLYVENLEEIH